MASSSLDQLFDVAVVGGSAAGLSAALVLARCRRSVFVVDAGHPRNESAAHVGGFWSQEGKRPDELVKLGREQVQGYGTHVWTGTAERINPGSGRRHFTLELDNRSPVRARRVVLASGMTDVLPELPGIHDRWGRDVVHCPYCHGWDLQDRHFAVLSCGPISTDQAILATQWSGDVTVLEHTSTMSELDRHRLQVRGINIVTGPVDGLVVIDDQLRGVRLADGRTVPCEALFVEPKFRIDSDLVAGLGVALDSDAMATWVKTNDTGATNVAGLWAAGNVATPGAQVMTAAAAGLRAGIAINVDLLAADRPDRH